MQAVVSRAAEYEYSYPIAAAGLLILLDRGSRLRLQLTGAEILDDIANS
jgi:hypothetical protein